MVCINALAITITGDFVGFADTRGTLTGSVIDGAASDAGISILD